MDQIGFNCILFRKRNFWLEWCKDFLDNYLTHHNYNANNHICIESFLLLNGNFFLLIKVHHETMDFLSWMVLNCTKLNWIAFYKEIKIFWRFWSTQLSVFHSSVFRWYPLHDYLKCFHWNHLGIIINNTQICYCCLKVFSWSF